MSGSAPALSHFGAEAPVLSAARVPVLAGMIRGEA
jgi:hypothetical protein